MPILAEFSKIHGGIRVIVHVHNMTAKAIAQLGTAAQKQALLPQVATGERLVAFGLTEPDAGTGRDIKARAVRDGDHFVLTGRKHLITNSEFASHFMVFCSTRTRAAATTGSAPSWSGATRPASPSPACRRRWDAAAASTAT